MENLFERSQGNFINKTLVTMSMGLLVTFVTAILTPMFMAEAMTKGLMIGAMVAELVVVFYLSARVRKMSVSSARFCFYLYAALNGFTMSIIFVSYDIKLVSTVFLITSAMFLCSAMVGMTTKKDLSMFGRFLMMMVLGLLLLTVVQVAFGLSGMSFGISILGIGVFCGLTAYDMQKIKRFHAECYYLNPEDVSKFVIISALELYLDFINLFWYIFRLFTDD